MKKLVKVKVSLIIIISMLFFVPFLDDFKNRKNEFFIGKDTTVWHITQNNANIYLVKTSDNYFLIDSGNPDKAKKLVAEIEKIGVSPADIDYLILTHAHPDHAGNTHYFQEKYGTKIIAGLGEKEMIDNKGEDKDLCPTGFMGRIIQKTIAQKRYDPFVTDIIVDELYNLEEIGLQGKIVPVPGHTEGSLVIYIGNAVFVGDIIRGKLLQNKKPTRHIFVCDYEQNLKNIETIAKIEDVETWFPGHGGPLNQNDVLKFIKKEKSK